MPLTKVQLGMTDTLVSGTAVTASGTAVNFTDIPAGVKRITVMFSGVSTNGTSIIQVQLGDSGGFETTGYFSNYAAINGGTGQGNITTGFHVTGGSAATSVSTGKIVIDLFSGTTWVANGVLLYTNAAGAMLMTAGNKTLSDTLTQVRITTVNGTDTFDAGTINIMYE